MKKASGPLVLWGAGTPRSMRPCWMLCELDLEFEHRVIGSRTGETQTPEYRELNPREKIPVLEDGQLVLAESAAIVTYLGETYGEGTGLLPEPGTAERARYWMWSFFAMMELDAHTLYVARKHEDLADIYGEAPNAIRAAREGFQKQVGVASLELERGGPFILGDRFTAADILLVSCLDWARVVYGWPLTDALRAYAERASSREAYRRAFRLNFRSPP